MRKLSVVAACVVLAATGSPVVAQDATSTAGSMSATEAGAAPLSGTSSANYAAWAADSDMFEIQSSQLALTKASSDGVKQFAREMIADHRTTTKALLAALPKTSPKVPKPPMKLSEANQAKIAQLKAASGTSFDSLYMQQQMMAHQQAWALHKGYATDGTDPALRQVAVAAVPIIEKHLQHVKTMPGGM